MKWETIYILARIIFPESVSRYLKVMLYKPKNRQTDTIKSLSFLIEINEADLRL